MSIKSIVRGSLVPIQKWSLRAALRTQGLSVLAEQLEGIEPDLTRQYTSHDSSSLEVASHRALHAFQISLAQRALGRAESANAALTVVDVGDSAGTHLAYLRALRPQAIAETWSLNLDPVAVDRINAKGGRAVLASAQQLSSLNIRPQLVLCYETLEHLEDPAGFLRSISGLDATLVLTIPFVRRSRLALTYIRNEWSRRGLPIGPETVHIWELSPQDFRLLAEHAGWAVVEDQVFLQYPPLARPALGRFWRRLDFEGFYGAILRPDNSYSRLYGP